jgi:hypothetical protein
MVKMNDSTVFMEIHIRFVEHTSACIEKYLFSSVDLLHRKIFSVFSVKNGIFFITHSRSFIRFDGELVNGIPVFLDCGLNLSLQLVNG